MNVKDMNGKQIRSLWWPAEASGQQQTLNATDEIRLEMSATYHGDHDEFWIVEHKKIGGEFREARRHNPRFVEGWEWA